MMSEEPVEVSDEVRKEIQTRRGKKNRAGQDVIDVMSHPELPQGKRLVMQERFFEPVYERLYQEDVRKKQEGQQQQGQAGKEGKATPGQGSAPSQEKPVRDKQEEPKPGAEPTSHPGDPEAMFKDLYDEYFGKSPDAALTGKQIKDAVDAALKKLKKEKRQTSLPPRRMRRRSVYRSKICGRTKRFGKVWRGCVRLARTKQWWRKFAAFSERS